MKPSYIFFAALSLVLSSSVSAQTNWYVQPNLSQQTHTMDWSITAQSGSPNVVSELQWQQVTMDVVGADVMAEIGHNWQWQMGVVSGQGATGSVIDSDYNGNNRTQLFSRSTSQVADTSLNGFLWKHT